MFLRLCIKHIDFVHVIMEYQNTYLKSGKLDLKNVYVLHKVCNTMLMYYKQLIVRNICSTIKYKKIFPCFYIKYVTQC